MADRPFCPDCTSGCEKCGFTGRVDKLPFADWSTKVFYHEHPKVGVCEHEWSEPPADWDRSQDYMPTCTKCGMSLMAHAFMEMP